MTNCTWDDRDDAGHVGRLTLALIHLFHMRHYIADVYMKILLLISLVVMLITSNLLDHVGVPLAASALNFANTLNATFSMWYAVVGIYSLVSCAIRAAAIPQMPIHYLRIRQNLSYGDTMLSELLLLDT